MSHDVIVVGARVAGAAIAMLLARRGLRVLALDRSGFPSDTISSHQVQVPGVAKLHEWGLLDAVRASGAPATRDVRFDSGVGSGVGSGQVVLHGRFPAFGGVDALYSPRRTILDSLLVDAARAAGAEVREHFRVDELVFDGDRVTGVRGRERTGPSTVETARIVIGADGKHSFVAQAVGAQPYRQRPVRAFACYTYWSGLPVTGGEIYQRPNRTVAVFPTNDDLTMVYISAPIGEFEAFRSDIEANYLRTLDTCGTLGERVRSAERAERIRTTPDQPNLFRQAHGSGWALAGDAGVVMDSLSAQGITNALRDADLLAHAIATAFEGTATMDAALASRHRLRDRAITPMYDFTMRLARFQPRRVETMLLRALRHRPAEIDRFLGAIAGIVPADRYFSARNALGLLVTSALRPARARAAGTKPGRLRSPA